MSNPRRSSRRAARLEKAVRYVSDYHLPVNAKLMETIEKNLQDGCYVDDRLGLVRDLQSDLGAFTACLKELKKHLSSETPLDPATSFQSVELGVLKEVISSVRSLAPTHSYEQSEEFQIVCSVESQITRSAAECLAPSSELDIEAAGTAGLLRTLGRALIAWNYPQVYSDCLATLQEEERELDLLLAQRLGFSPAILATRMLSEWGISVEYSFEIGLLDEVEVQVAQQVGATYATIARIGEKLARSNFPELYPTAKADWESAREAIESQIGEGGMEEITNRFYSNSEALTEIVPEVFHAGLVLDPLHRLLARDGIQNPYLSASSPGLKKGLTQFYELDCNPAETEARLRELRSYLESSKRFQGGIIYTIDPLEGYFLPQSSFGEVRLRSIHEAVPYSVGKGAADVIPLSFVSVEPVFDVEDEDTVGIAGMFGHTQRIGVLYLEAPITYPGITTDFKAVLYTLKDLLALN